MTEDMTIAEKMDLLKQIDELEFEVSNGRLRREYLEALVVLDRSKRGALEKHIDNYKAMLIERGEDIREYRKEIYKLKEKIRTLEEELKHVDSQSK